EEPADSLSRCGRVATKSWCPTSQHPGDRSWGQVPGFSGPVRVAQGTRRTGRRGRIDQRKTRREARLLHPAGERFNLHGKEVVDGSSPSEGVTKGQQMAVLLSRHRTQVARLTLNLAPRLVPKCCGARDLGLERGLGDCRAPP